MFFSKESKHNPSHKYVYKQNGLNVKENGVNFVACRPTTAQAQGVPEPSGTETFWTVCC